MSISKTAQFFFALIKTSIRASMSMRASFLLEVIFMMANNIIFFVVWWLFFRQFKDIGGWTIQEMISVMAIGSGGFGIMQVFFGGMRSLARIIINGDLDPFMTQPKNLLIHILGSKSNARGWGDIISMIIFMILGGFYTWNTAPLILLGAVCAGLVFTSAGIMAHSLAFWLGSVEHMSHKYFDSLLIFALYPTNIYSGFLQVVMFTVIPAGIIGYLPVELVRDFSWLKLGILIASTLFFTVLAFTVFYLGMRRYESGNQFGLRL